MRFSFVHIGGSSSNQAASLESHLIQHSICFWTDTKAKRHAAALTWREGSNAPLASRFAAVRVHPAARDNKRTTPHPVEWRLAEWPKGEAAPAKYWLSTLPGTRPSPHTPIVADRAGASNVITKSSKV